MTRLRAAWASQDYRRLRRRCATRFLRRRENAFASCHCRRLAWRRSSVSGLSVILPRWGAAMPRPYQDWKVGQKKSTAALAAVLSSLRAEKRRLANNLDGFFDVAVGLVNVLECALLEALGEGVVF